jgi:hypothetical protein
MNVLKKLKQLRKKIETATKKWKKKSSKNKMSLIEDKDK